jgi:hypothetical protein
LADGGKIVAARFGRDYSRPKRRCSPAFGLSQSLREQGHAAFEASRALAPSVARTVTGLAEPSFGASRDRVAGIGAPTLRGP